MSVSRRALMYGAFAQRRRKVLVCLIDGMGLDYIAQSEMPNLKQLMRQGTFRAGQGMMPSLTNVNNASLATGTYPELHGITANTFFDPALGRIVEMSDTRYLLAPTLFEKARSRGWKTAFVGAKDKIRSLIGVRADVAICAEKQGVPMYEAENSYWVFEQGREALKKTDFLYLTTTDYMMHTYPAEDERSREHLKRIDEILGQVLNDHPGLELYLCADHGMNAKTLGLDPVKILAARGIRARGAAAIADKHKVHHNDLGGSIYLDLEKSGDIAAAREILSQEPGIDEVLLRNDAARRFRLKADRTGDLYVLAGKHAALGDLKTAREEIRIRTHGSLHETTIPLLVYGRKVDELKTIVDLTAGLMREGFA